MYLDVLEGLEWLTQNKDQSKHDWFHCQVLINGYSDTLGLQFSSWSPNQWESSLGCIYPDTTEKKNDWENFIGCFMILISLFPTKSQTAAVRAKPRIAKKVILQEKENRS